MGTCHVVAAAARWLERIDPGTHRRIKGLRLVTAYGIAAMLGTMADIKRGLPAEATLSVLAGGFALWASVSEGRATRVESSRDLTLLSAAAVLGAGMPLGTAVHSHLAALRGRLEEERVELKKSDPAIVSTMVMRERSSTSVLQTTRLSMLKPRAARIPDTRDSTPGSFCTRQFRM